jgi:hypothetical protein
MTVTPKDTSAQQEGIKQARNLTRPLPPTSGHRGPAAPADTLKDTSAQQVGIKQALNLNEQRHKTPGYRSIKQGATPAEDQPTGVNSITVSSIEQKLDQLIEILKVIADSISRFANRRGNSRRASIGNSSIRISSHKGRRN